MPLTLACSCNPSLDYCVLTGLTWHIEWNNTQDGVQHPQSLILWLQELGGSRHVDSGASMDIAGSADIALTPLANWKADWGTLNIYCQIASSLSQGTHYPGYNFYFSSNIKQTWTCAGTTTYVYSYGIGNDSQQCLDGTLVEFQGLGGGGGGSMYQWHSSPLAACTSIAINLAGFSNPPTNDLFNTNNPCLCATGGTSPYRFAIVSGALPSGQALDPTTGCVTGTPDGVTQGSSPITYQVTDSAGATAKVSCAFNAGCAPPGVAIWNDFN